MKFSIPMMAGLLLIAAPAHAIVGGGAPSAEGVGRSVVTIVGSRGNFCTGALIAPKLVLTAAHCVQPGAKTPSALGMPDIPITVGGRFTIAGIGVTVRGDGKSGGTIRVAGLVATGKPGTLQIRLVDPVGQGLRDGMGACTGDSGGPVVEDKPTGPAIIGVISWSTGPNGSAGCGGMTGVTPLTLYRDWILQTARQWGAGL
jgi:hypothetical protein